MSINNNEAQRVRRLVIKSLSDDVEQNATGIEEVMSGLAIAMTSIMVSAEANEIRLNEYTLTLTKEEV